MADFDPAFSSTANKRYPTADEQANGFPCGPADQFLFNGLFHRIEKELGAVILHAGIVPSDASLTQLRDAIMALIAGATGGGDPANYLTLAQASSRLPFFPEVQNADGRIEVTSPLAGTVRVPGGVNFMHRGVSPQATAQQDFATLASKIYHLRWRPATGFVLLDTGDAAYNPGGLPETHMSLDTQYDDMLVSRIITNAANVATISNLSNKARLAVEGTEGGAITTLPRANGAERTGQLVWNLSRSPILSVYPSQIDVAPTDMSRNIFTGSDGHDHDEILKVLSKTRYGASVRMFRDHAWAYHIDYQAQA